MEFLFKFRHNQFIQEVRANNVCLSLSSNPGGGLLDILDGLLLGLLCLLVSCGSLLGSGLLLGVLGSSHRLLSLGLSDLGLLVPLGHNVLESGADHGSLELLGPLVPLLGDVLLGALLVLPAVEHGPAGLTGIPLQEVSLVGPAAQEPEGEKLQLFPGHHLLLVALAVHLDQGPPVAGVDLVAGIHTQVYLHDDFVFCNTTDIRLG